MKIRNIILSVLTTAVSSFGVVASPGGVTPAASKVSEDFNSMWSDNTPTLNLPEGWRVDRNLTAPRKVGKWNDAVTDVMYTGGANLASNAKNGTWNWGPDDASSDRAVGGLSTTVSNGTRCVSYMTKLTNEDDAKIINYLDISYVVEKYRLGANAAGFSVQLYWSGDGEKWYSAGESFNTYFPADASTAGVAVVPVSQTEVGNSLRVHVEPKKDIYLAWNISVASGSTPDKAQGLAIDDVEIQASFTDKDDDWKDPSEDVPEINHSGIYMRGQDGWDASDEWEFDKIDETTFVLRDKIISGTFKIADASWSASCNYGSNGTNIVMDMPYELKAGVDGNISCGPNVFNCSLITLTIKDGVATLLLSANEDAEGLTSVYVIGDNNGWNYMDASGILKYDASDKLFKGRVSMPAGSDGLSRWMIYQRLGMAGAWGLNEDSSLPSTEGTLIKGKKCNACVEPGTYDITFDLQTGGYTFTKVSSAVSSLVINPVETILVPELPSEIKVLSLNNSLIYYNDQDVMFNDIAKGEGKVAEWTKHTLLGKPLSTHWNEGEGLADDGQPGAKMLVRSQPWSHIILQEQSSLPRTDPETFRNNVKLWVEYIRQRCPNPNAVIIMPVNWAYAGDWGNFTKFNELFIANYSKVAAEFGIVLCPVANAYQAVYDDKGAVAAEGLFLDDRHPTAKATYMAACMEYGLIFGTDPLDISTHPTSISSAEALEMRTYASNALKGFIQTVDHHSGMINFDARMSDEFGMDVEGDITFHADNGATISPKGVFKAPDCNEAVYNVTANGGGFEAKAVVMVRKAVEKMDIIPSVDMSAGNTHYIQNFDEIGDAAAARLPKGWRVQGQQDGELPSFYKGVENTTYAGGVSLPSNAKNGLWNFGASTSTDRAVGGITTGVAGGTRKVNVMLLLTNSGKKKLTDISLSYDIEKYRKGSNPAGFDVTLFYSNDGVNWVENSDENLNHHFDADDVTAGFEVVPGETVSKTGFLSAELIPGAELYLMWQIAVASGNNFAAAPALAIDNVEIEGQLPPVPVYDWHIYVDDKTGYASMGAYAYGALTTDEFWGGWPGQAPIDEVVIDGTKYKVFGHNRSEGSYNLILNNWNNGSQLPDFVFEGGRDYYLLATSDKVTEKTLSDVRELEEQGDMQLFFKGDTLIADDSDIIAIYDMQGREILRTPNGSLNVGNLVSGIYVAKASGKDVMKVIKIYIE